MKLTNFEEKTKIMSLDCILHIKVELIKASSNTSDTHNTGWKIKHITKIKNRQVKLIQYLKSRT